MSADQPIVDILDSEITWHAVRAQGAGGQNVNKVATAIHLRFDIRGSSLPEDVKARLLALRDRRITPDGIVIIKAQRHRSQEKNREDALDRLKDMVAGVWCAPIHRRPTRPTRASREKRIQQKKRRSRLKSFRRGDLD